jgi:DNA (cytosine-5)-methyltransferase 1
MNHIGLFEGIGGFSLAAHKFGIETIAWCEWNPFCQIILKDLLPNANQHNDIKSTDFTVYRGQCYLLTGGFPCQPFSVAGQQKGTGDDRYLWPEMFRAIREIQPRWVIAENVPGLVSWSDGLVFEQVLSDLESEGYEVTSFILPAASINAPHKRDRVWIVAYSDNKRSTTGFGEVSKKNGEISKRNEDPKFGDTDSDFTSDTSGTGIQINEAGNVCDGKRDYTSKVWSNCIQSSGFRTVSAESVTSDSQSPTSNRLPFEKKEEYPINGVNGCDGVTSDSGLFGQAECKQQTTRIIERSCWQSFTTQSPVCIGDDGLPTDALRQRIREDSMGALSEKEIHKIISESVSYHRKESIKAGGNAIVPQVAEQIIQSILDFEKNVAYYQQ